MQRSILSWIQQISDLLLQLPAIVNAFERKSPQALADYLRWLDRTEALLSGSRMVEAAQIAGYKSRIIASAHDESRRATSRKRQIAAALAGLHDVQRTVQDALEPSSAKLRQAREITRLLLQIVAQSGAVKYDPKIGFDVLIAQIWGLCTHHEQLKPHAIQLKALLSSDDIKLLLAGEIELTDFSGDSHGNPSSVATRPDKTLQKP